GRGIGLENKIKAYQLIQSDPQIDIYTANKILGFPVDMRSYQIPLAILKSLNIQKLALLTSNPEKFDAFSSITSTVVPLVCKPNEYNSRYLLTKHIRESTLCESPQYKRYAKLCTDDSPLSSPSLSTKSTPE